MTAGDDIYGSAEHLAFRETVRKFVQSELVPRAREFDHLGRIDKTVYPKMGALGLLGIRWDPQYGGQGLDYSYHAVFLEELALCDNAATADWLCLLAVTDPEAGYGGFSQIIVPTDRPGLTYQLLDKIGNKGSDTGLFFFEDVRVPLSNTIGDPHRGFQQQMNQFQD